MRKSPTRVIASDRASGYNAIRNPKDAVGDKIKQGTTALVCILMLMFAISKPITAQAMLLQPGNAVSAPAIQQISPWVLNIEPGMVKGVIFQNRSVQPAMWLGMGVTLLGALILGLSVIVLAKYEA